MSTSRNSILPQIKPGLHADLVLAEFPGRKFQGTVVRSSGAIDNTTRTLLTEVDVENSSHLLKPGGYVEVHLKLPSPVNTFTLPVNATIFKSAGLQVAIVKNGKTISLSPLLRAVISERKSKLLRGSKEMNGWS